MKTRALALCVAFAAVWGSASAAEASPAFASTYQAPPSRPTLIRNATVLTGTGTRLDGADVLLRDGKVEAVGVGIAAGDAEVVDASGRWVTPGLIDVHSHLGVYANPGMAAHADGNEMVDPVTAQVWAEHAVWPQDPGFQTALEGGVTTMQVLPGSGNLVGGRGVTLRNVQATTYQAMKFPGAPQGLKMACGENPKRYYGGMMRAPMTRMGNVAGYRQAFADAQEYQRGLDKYARELAAYEKKQGKAKGKDDEAAPPSPPKRDLRLETLAAAMRGEVLRADPLLPRRRDGEHARHRDRIRLQDLRLPPRRGGLQAGRHAGRARRVRRTVGRLVGLQDGGLRRHPGEHRPGRPAGQRLRDRAFRFRRRHPAPQPGSGQGAWRAACAPGSRSRPERAIRWITANPARALGIDDRTGTLEPGKLGDVVVWNRDPFSVYALAERVYLEGALVYDRARPAAKPRSDFLLGQPGQAVQP